MLNTVSGQSKFFTEQQKSNLFQIKNNISARVTLFFRTKKQLLDFMQINVINLSPEMVLKRGYSITRFNGRVVKNVNVLKPGDLLHIKIADGKILSTVLDKSNNNE